MRFILLFLLTLTACASNAPKPASIATLQTGPTIVFEAGLGDGKESWNSLRKMLPPALSQFAWSRAGYTVPLFGGKLWPSDKDGSRTGAEVAVHLDETLRKGSVPPPYILVAHSIGASYVLSFTKAHPDQVAGIVLVDPRLPGFTARCLQEQLRLCQPPKILIAALSPAERVEFRGIAETESALTDLSTLRNIPITILTATRPSIGEDPRMRGVWQSYADEFALQFNNARRVNVQGSGHYIHHDASDAEIDEILRMVQTSAQPL